eukprot:CFRG5203T1
MDTNELADNGSSEFSTAKRIPGTISELTTNTHILDKLATSEGAHNTGTETTRKRSACGEDTLADTKTDVHVKTHKRLKPSKTTWFGSQRIEGCRPFKYETYGYAAERRGEREEMQDAHVVIEDLWQLHDKPRFGDAPRLAFYGVYDGHAGDRASKYTAEHLHQHFLSNVAGYLEMLKNGLIETFSQKEIRKCIVDSFKRTDADFLKLAATEGWKDGTTAVVVILYDDVMYVANLGDSGAVLAKETDKNDDGPIKYKSLPVTKEHNPMVHTERMRIQKAGGSVTNGRLMGILEVSRSIGDGALKHVGLTCVPEIVSAPLTGKEKFVILGCDGLWSDLPRSDAVAFAGSYMQSETSLSAANTLLDDQEILLTDEEKALRQADRPATIRCILIQSVSKALVNEAVRRGSTDNTSALIIGLGEI